MRAAKRQRQDGQGQPAPAGNAHRAEVVFVAGMTGTGKTLWIMRQIGRPQRLMIWSPKEPIDRYAQKFGGRLVTTATAAVDCVKAAGAGPFCMVFAPPGSRKRDTALFSEFCELARAARDVVVLVDELHTVTMPSCAPDGWSKLNLMGRGYGVRIYAASQRPASVDKDFFGNCSFFHCGRLGYMEDAKVMARLLGVAPTELIGLPDLHFIEREPRSMAPANRGALTIP